MSLLSVLLLLVASTIPPYLSQLRGWSPSFESARNLKQIGLAIITYANNHGGQLPDSFQTLLATEDISPGLFVYPESKDTPATGAAKRDIVADFSKPGHCSYLYFGNGLSNTGDPDVVLACELPTKENRGGSNVLFLDGRVEWLEPTEAEKIRPKLGTGRVVWRQPEATQPSTQSPNQP